MSSTDARSDGFTLVEVLVALVVTSLLLVVVMDGAIGARQREDRSAEKAAAVGIARELLVQRSAAPFAEGRSEGQDDRSGLDWEIRENVAQHDPRGRFVLAEIAVEVRGRRGNTLLVVTGRRLKPQALS